MDSVCPENDSRPLPVSSSRGTDDDKHLSQAKSNRFIAADSLIIEEHPQYDLFKQWGTVKRYVLEQRLENRFPLFGEWVDARRRGKK